MRAILFGLAVVLVANGAAPELRRAESLYQQTRYREALDAVQPHLNQDPEALFLAGRAAYGMGEYKRAAEFLEKAAQQQPANSNYFHWLGRAYGRRAETGMALAAPHYASKARQHFEKAVQLNSANGEALNDLFDYYLQAPGFLGGGLDKAQALLPKIQAIDAAEYEYALAQLFEARKDFPAAEQHLRRAADLAPKAVGRLLDVARFLARRSRFSESLEWVGKAEKLAPKSPEVLFGTAQIYIDGKQNLPAARALLQAYLQAALNPELPSRDEAEQLLKKASRGL